MNAREQSVLKAVENEQSTRHTILVALKKQGQMTANDLAEMLAMTPMGVRRQLNLLERDGLVRYETVQRGMGRPSNVYRLSEQANDLFPKTYSQLTNELLGYIEMLDGTEHLEIIFQRRAQRRIQQAQLRLKTKPTLASRVAELAAILDEDGYLTEWEQVDGGTFLLREFNCAVHNVARRFQQACGSEIEFIQALLPEATVERQHHILRGETFCGYRIAARQDDNSA